MFGGKDTERNLLKRLIYRQEDLEASVSSTIESMGQEMQDDMDRRLQEEREKMTADLKSNMEEDLQKNWKRNVNTWKGEVVKMFQEQMFGIMPKMQLVFSLAPDKFFSFHC